MKIIDKKLFENKGSLLIRIPKAYAKLLKIESNEIVQVKLLNDKIEISKKEV
jgi:antitoxin component of MazEF toxin-antitoxin module